MESEQLKFILNTAAIISCAAAVFALIAVFRQIRQSGSSNAFNAMTRLDQVFYEVMEAMRSAGSLDDRAYFRHIERMLNCLEAICPLILDNAFHGHTRRSLVGSVDSCLHLLNESQRTLSILKSKEFHHTDYEMIRGYLENIEKFPLLRNTLRLASKASSQCPWRFEESDDEFRSKMSNGLL